MTSNSKTLKAKKIKKKTKAPISPSIKKALADRNASKQNKTTSIHTLDLPINNASIQAALNQTKVANLITQNTISPFSELTSIVSLLDENHDDNQIDEILNILESHVNAQSNDLAYRCMRSVFDDCRLITPEDIRLSFSQQSSIELLAKLYHANFTKKIIKYANTFIQEKNLHEFYAAHSQEIQRDYILHLKEYYTFSQNIMTVIQNEALRIPLSETHIQQTKQSIIALETELNMLEDNAKYYIHNKMHTLFVTLIQRSQSRVDEIAQSSSAEDISLFQFVQNTDEFDFDILLPQSLIYILIDELQADKGELTRLLNSVSKQQYDFLNFISNRKIDFEDERLLIESLSPDILNTHLNSHKDYQFIINLIESTTVKVENLQKCLPIINQLITLSNYMTENNKIISDIVQQARDHNVPQIEQLEAILESFNDTRIVYDQYMEELQEALSSAETMTQILYDIKNAHISKINSIFELRPKDLIESFSINNTDSNVATIQVRETINTITPIDTLQLPNQDTKTPHYPEAEITGNETLPPVENKTVKSATLTSEWDFDIVKNITNHINEFLRNINTFNDALCQCQSNDSALADAIYALKRTFALKQNSYRRLLSEKSLPEIIVKNTPITEQSLLVYMQIIDEFCSFGSRGALRLFFIQNNIPQLPKTPQIDVLANIEDSLHRIPKALKSPDFLAREHKIKKRFENVRQITHTNNNLAVILRGELLHNSIDAIKRLLPQDIEQQISALYSHTILLKTKEIEQLQSQRNNVAQNTPDNKPNKDLSEHKQQLQNWKNLSPYFQAGHMGKYFSKIEQMLSQYQSLVQKSAKLKLKYGHTFDVKALVKYEHFAKQCDILHGIIIKQHQETFQLLECMSHIDSLSPELMMLLAPFKNHILSMELQKANILLHLEYKKDSTPLKSFILHFTLGQFFANKNSDKQTQFTKALCMGMHTYFKPSTLIDMTIASFNNTDLTCEHNNALIFIRTIINMDMNSELFHYKGMDNSTSTKLHHFLNLIKDAELTPIVNEVKHLIIDKKNKNKAEYYNTLNRLALKATPYLSKETLSTMIYDLVYQLENLPEEQHANTITEFRDILYYTHPSYFDTKNDNLLSPDTAVQLFITTAREQNIITSNNAIVSEYQNKKQSTQTTEKNIPSSIQTIAHISHFTEILIRIENMAKSRTPTKQQDIFIDELINMIEKTYQHEMLNIGSTELICSALNLDHINASDNPYKTPDSLHINRTEEFNVKLDTLFSVIIFFEYHNGLISPRKKTKECENIIYFYERVLNTAFKSHSYKTFEIIYHVLTKSHILRLSQNNTNATENFNTLFKNKKRLLAKMIKEHNGIPLIEKSKQKLIDLIESQTISLPSKFITIGQEALQISDYKKLNFAKQKKTALNINLINFMNSYLSAILSNCHYAPYVQDYIFDGKISPSDLPQLSQEIKPEKTPSAISITEFKSISALINYLHNCSNKGWGYNLIEDNPQEKIIEFMAQHLEGNTNSPTTEMPDFNESMSIFKLFNELEAKEDVRQL